jgi:hypothetical protein
MTSLCTPLCGEFIQKAHINLISMQNSLTSLTHSFFVCVCDFDHSVETISSQTPSAGITIWYSLDKSVLDIVATGSVESCLLFGIVAQHNFFEGFTIH